MNKSRTVTAFGREWSPRQFYGLVRALMNSRVTVRFGGAYDDGVCEIWSPRHGCKTFSGQGPTPWLAMVAAVEKMEGTR